MPIISRQLRPKKLIEYALRPFPSLYRFGSKFYHKAAGSFRPCSPGTPDGVSRALRLALELNPDDVGDYYEFGVFRGYTFLSAQQCCDELQITDMRFYGFDSFKGFPKLEEVDQARNLFFEGQCAASKESVVKDLDERGFDWSRGHLIEGMFDESLTTELKSKFPFRRAGVALLDCDLYSSTRDTLAWLVDYLADNSVLLFDDWFTYGRDPELGQQRAFAEFLTANPDLKAEPLWDFSDYGTAFLLHKA